MAINPFKPTAGKMPPILIGRHSIIEDFSEALTNGVGAPGRIMLVTGQRGFGKTVMLTEFRRIAKAQHWEVIGETASAGLRYAANWIMCRFQTSRMRSWRRLRIPVRPSARRTRWRPLASPTDIRIWCSSSAITCGNPRSVEARMSLLLMM